MITEQNIIEFIQDKHPELQESKEKQKKEKGISSYERWQFCLNKVANFEVQIKKPFEQFTQADFIKLFELNSWSSKNTFHSNKSIVRDFGNWYFKTIIGIKNIPFGHSKISPIEYLDLEDVSSDERYRKEYFKDYDEFISCLEEMFGPLAEERYVMQKAFFALMWEGLNRDELRAIKHEDISISSNEMAIKLHDRTITVTKTPTIDIVKLALDVIKYDYVDKNGIVRSRKYVDTKMLLRSSGKKPTTSHLKITEGSVSNYYTDQFRISNELPETDRFYGKKLVFRGVSDSGAFYRLAQNGRFTNITQEEIILARQIVSVSPLIVGSFNYNYSGWLKYFGY